MSWVMASIILRKLAAWASARDLKSMAVSLLTPSTRAAISSPNSVASWSRELGVSSSTSWSSAAIRQRWSMRISPKIRATAMG